MIAAALGEGCGVELTLFGLALMLAESDILLVDVCDSETDDVDDGALLVDGDSLEALVSEANDVSDVDGDALLDGTDVALMELASETDAVDDGA